MCSHDGRDPPAPCTAYRGDTETRRPQRAPRLSDSAAGGPLLRGTGAQVGLIHRQEDGAVGRAAEDLLQPGVIGRFGQVFVESGVERRCDVAVLSVAAQRDEPDVLVVAIRPDAAGELE